MTAQHAAWPGPGHAGLGLPGSARRAFQSQVLRRGLTYSALTHLTLVVLLFGLVTSREVTRIEPHVTVPWQPGPPEPPTPRPDPGGKPPVPPKPDDGPPIPTDSVFTETELVPPDHEDGSSGPNPNGDMRNGSGPSSRDGNGTAGNGVESIEPVEIWLVEQLPREVTRITPEYPEIAKQAGIEGTVIVRALVGLDGRVEQTQIEKSIDLLDEAAADAARGWVFTPALMNDRPVRVWVRIPMKFSLR